jgi:hypothetical protein
LSTIYFFPPPLFFPAIIPLLLRARRRPAAVHHIGDMSRRCFISLNTIPVGSIYFSPLPRSPTASPLGMLCESQIALCLTSTYICDTNISYYRTNLNNSSNTSTSGVLPEGFTIVERIFSFFSSAIIRCAVCGFNPVSLMKLDVRITGVINSASRT